MALNFNGIPTTIRTPGTYVEIDNSRALKGLVANPHKALVVGQKVAEGSAGLDALYAVTSEALADSYFGPGSLLSRMIKVFKKNNPNTELFAIALSSPGGAVKASCTIKFSVALSATGGSVTTDGEQVKLLINGSKIYFNLTSGWSVKDVNSTVQTAINALSMLPVTASTNAASALNLMAVNFGEQGNYLDARFNFYAGESNPTCFGDSAQVVAFANGAGNPDMGDAWAVIDNEQFHHVVNPYIDSANLTELEGQLETRWGPMVDQAGVAYTAVRGTLASCTTLGNSRNSPYNTIMGAYDSPTDPAEWAAAVGAVAAFNLNNDPARPIQMLKIKGVLSPNITSRFTREERDNLLYDGIATWINDASGNVLIERLITTYQTNALGIADPSYLDVETLATLMELRYQFKARMITRFIIPRFKLADDSFPVQPGTYVATPKTVKAEIVALFRLLYSKGLIENLEEFETNLIVERDETDVNRVNTLLPPDLVNQFRVLAGQIQFIL